MLGFSLHSFFAKDTVQYSCIQDAGLLGIAEYWAFEMRNIFVLAG
jgi:hypothetical protein